MATEELEDIIGVPENQVGSWNDEQMQIFDKLWTLIKDVDQETKTITYTDNKAANKLRKQLKKIEATYTKATYNNKEVTSVIKVTDKGMDFLILFLKRAEERENTRECKKIK